MLSIIIPVYNSEAYISECIESILSQSFNDIELLLIDNMSTDSSPIICQSYVNKDSRIKLFFERKKGAAAARNRGLRESRGEYLTFVDSDDYISSNSYEKIVKKMIEVNADLGCFSFNCVNEHGEHLNWHEPHLKKYQNKIYDGKMIAKVYLESLDIEGFCWNKVFKRNLFFDNGIFFDESKTAFEDMAIIFDLISKCDSVILFDDRCYYYRQVDASLTHIQYNKKNVEYRDSIQHIMKTAKSIGLTNEAYTFYISRSVWQKYNELKIKGYIKEKSNCGFGIFFKHQLNLLFHLKSEKCKTIAKALLLFVNREYSIEEDLLISRTQNENNPIS